MDVMNENRDPAQRYLFRFELGWRQEIAPLLARCPFHNHVSTELVYHEDGSGTTALDSGKKVRFEKGGVVIYPPGMVHNQIAQLPAIDRVIHLKPLCDDIIAVNECLYIPAIRSSLCLTLIDELSSARSIISEEERAGLSLKGSVLMYNLLQETHITQTNHAPASNKVYAQQAYDFIRIRFRGITHLEQVSNELNVTYDFIRRVFRQQYGMSLKTWLMQVRHEQSRVLLKNSVLTYSVIADLCGYTDERYFCTSFKKLENMTPGKYRRTFTRCAASLHKSDQVGPDPILLHTTAENVLNVPMRNVIPKTTTP